MVFIFFLLIFFLLTQLVDNLPELFLEDARCFFFLLLLLSLMPNVSIKKKRKSKMKNQNTLPQFGLNVPVVKPMGLLYPKLISE